MSNAPHTGMLSEAAAITAAMVPDAWIAYVYGSVARGDARPGSDLDLAVLLPPKHELPDRLTLMATVATKVGCDVDIVDLRRAGLDLIHEVLRDGISLFNRQPDAVLAWEAERMSEYAEFNPRRAAIISQYMSEPLRAAP